MIVVLFFRAPGRRVTAVYHAARRGRLWARAVRPVWTDPFQFFVTNTYNIIIMVTKVKYNIIATNEI